MLIKAMIAQKNQMRLWQARSRADRDSQRNPSKTPFYIFYLIKINRMMLDLNSLLTIFIIVTIKNSIFTNRQTSFLCKSSAIQFDLASQEGVITQRYLGYSIFRPLQWLSALMSRMLNNKRNY